MKKQEVATKQYSAKRQGIELLYEEAENFNTLTLGLWIRNGSRHEKSGEWGYAHFLEHMLFKGTPSLGPKGVAQKIDELGGYINAATTREYTLFSGVFTPELWQRGLRLLCDIVFYPRFPPREISREQGVVLEEIKMYQDSPEDFLMDQFLDQSFPPHSLGHNELGTEESVTGITREKLTDYYSRNYYGNNLLLVGVGPLAAQDFFAGVDKVLSRVLPKLPLAQGGQPRKGRPAQARFAGKHWHRELEQLHFIMTFPGFALVDRQFPALSVFNVMVGGNQSSMLFQNLREKRGLCYQVGSFSNSFSDVGLWSIAGSTDYQRFDRLYNETWKILRKIYDKGFKKSEINAAKNFLKVNIMLSLESSEARMRRLARRYILKGKFFSTQRLIEKINAVDGLQLQDIARSILESERFGLYTLGRQNGHAWLPEERK